MSASRQNKRIARINELRGRMAEWSAQHHQQQLLDGMRAWLCEQPPRDPYLGPAIAFALLCGYDAEPSLVQRYRDTLRAPSRLDRMVFESWEQSWFGLFEVSEVEPGLGMRMDDVFSGDSYWISERSASLQMHEGDWLFAVLQPVDGRLELEGTAAEIGPMGRLDVVQAWINGAMDRDLDPYQVQAEDSRRLALAAVEALRRSERRPKLVNHDGDRIVLLEAVVDCDWVTARECLEQWSDVQGDDDSMSWIGRYEAVAGGRLVLASFASCLEGACFTITVNSEERLAAVFEEWKRQHGVDLAVRDRAVTDVQSDPQGKEVATDMVHVDSSAVDAQDGDYTAHLYADWANVPIPALDDLTPKQAVRAGRRAEVRALFPTLIDPEQAEALRIEAGL